MSERLSNVIAVIATLCAVVLTGLFVRREVVGRTLELKPSAAVSEWRQYAAAGHRMGGPSAPVTITVWSDFQCSACRQLAESLEKIRAKRGHEIAVVYRHFPLSTIHPFALAAARASECAARQDRFAAYHDALFRDQASIGDSTWAYYAISAKVPDLRAFDRCVTERGPLSAVQRDADAAARLGVTVTPTLLINGSRLDGAPPTEELERLILAAAPGPR